MTKLKTLLIIITLLCVNDLNASALYRYVSKSRRDNTVCADAVYLRRTYLLLTGELPKAERVESFLSSDSKNKRDELVAELLTTDSYFRYMQMR